MSANDARPSMVATFRQRLDEVIRRSGMNRSEFAEATGIDRSTLSQLLSASNRRLPRLETVAALARDGHVSIDWLVGFTNANPMQAEVVHEQTSFTPGGMSPNDERLAEWFAESVGYKIRYVPTTIPDLLKTEDVIRHEMRHYAATSPGQQISAAAAQLRWTRAPETDMEVCSSIQSVEALARGEGIWAGLGIDIRREQIEQMIHLTDELYPTLRWFWFDALEHYAAPVTIFGPLRAALYLGHMYLVLISAEHVRTLSRRFDGLIKAAVVQPPDIPARLRSLAATVA